MLAVDECEVWWRTVQPARQNDVALLDGAERARLNALRMRGDRNRFLTAAVLLRRRVAANSGVPADRVVVDRSCPTCLSPHGRPTLPGLNIHVSISHSADRVGVALTTRGSVGLDVERIKEVDIEALRGRVLDANERVDGTEGFLRYWARKESVVKATGDGIIVGLRNVEVSQPNEAPRLLSYPGCSRPDAVVRDLNPGDGYVAALTVLAEGGLCVREYGP